jgi:parallel beta-helix repeat protein
MINDGSGNGNIAIYFKSTENGTIENNTINTVNSACIYLYSSNNNNLTHNKVLSSNSDCISLESSPNNTIEYNNASNCGQFGIYISYSDNNNLTRNTVNNNMVAGVSVQHSNYNNLINNTANNNSQIGFHFYYGDNNNIINNTAKSNGNDGIMLWTSSDNNAVNGSILCYQFPDIANRSTNTGNIGYNNVCDNVDNWNDEGYTGCRYTCAAPPIYQENITNCTQITIPGIYNLTADILNSSNGTCLNATLSNVVLDCGGHLVNGIDNASSYGIYMQGSSNLVKNCKVNDWGHGIFLELSAVSNVTNNTVNSSVYGIVLTGIIGTSYNNVFLNNVSNTSYGLYLNHEDNNNFYDNIVLNSSTATFYSKNDSLNNHVRNLKAANNLIVGFDSTDIAVKDVNASGPDPTGYKNINKYVWMTNTSNSSWVMFNFSYLDSELGNVTENSLKIWRYTSSW